MTEENKQVAFYLERGTEAFGRGDFSEVIATYDEILNIQSDNHEALTIKHVVLTIKGVSLANLGRYEEAITAYDQALHFKPNFYETLNNKGNSLANLGRYEEAIAAIRRH